jgi:hypothetical protein
MNKNQISKTVMYTFIIVFLTSSIVVSSNNMAFALLGFFLGGGEEEQQSTGSSQSSSSLQSARCYSPHGSIVDSCNSDGLSSGHNTGYNGFTQ